MVSGCQGDIRREVMGRVGRCRDGWCESSLGQAAGRHGTMVLKLSGGVGYRSKGTVGVDVVVWVVLCSVGLCRVRLVGMTLRQSAAQWSIMERHGTSGRVVSCADVATETAVGRGGEIMSMP